MIFRLVKKAVKYLVIVYVVLLVVRPSAAAEIIDCDASDGSISIVGKEIPVDNLELLEAYSGIEKKASSLVPSEINKVIGELSDWISGLFGGEETERG